MFFVLTILVCASSNIYGIGYITKLYTVPEKYETSSYYKTPAVEEEMVKKNRRARLSAAWELLQSIRGGQDDAENDARKEKGLRNRNGKKGKEKDKMRNKQVKNNFEKEMDRLKEVIIDPMDRTVMYQNNPERKKKLLLEKEKAYNAVKTKTTAERRFMKGDITIEYSDDRTGVVLVTGNILDAGRTEEGLEEVQMTANEIMKNGKRRRIDDEGVEEKEVKKCFEDILKVDTGHEEMWVASTHVDLSRRRRRKESIKSVCSSIAAEKNRVPYVTMSNEQHAVMNMLYWGDIWRDKTWRTSSSTKEIMEKVMDLQRHFPSSVSPLIKTLMMSQGVSESTLDRVINFMQGKGLTTTQEVQSIGRISTWLIL